MRILILHDNRINFERAVGFIQLLGIPPETFIKVFVGGHFLSTRSAEDDIARIEPFISDYYPDYDITFSKGRFLNQAITQANSEYWDMVVYSEILPKGHLLPIGTSRKVMRLVNKIHHPFLLVRNEIDQLDSILVCTSAEMAAQKTLGTAGRLLSNATAKLVLLHVMSQVTLSQPGLEQDLLDNAETAITRQSKEGRHFTMGMSVLHESGFHGEIDPILRHGLVLDEVQSVLESKGSDLMVIGSHRIEGQSRIIEFLLEDVTKILVNETKISVLVIG